MVYFTEASITIRNSHVTHVHWYFNIAFMPTNQFQRGRLCPCCPCVLGLTWVIYDVCSLSPAANIQWIINWLHDYCSVTQWIINCLHDYCSVTHSSISFSVSNNITERLYWVVVNPLSQSPNKVPTCFCSAISTFVGAKFLLPLINSFKFTRYNNSPCFYSQLSYIPNFREILLE